MIHALRTRVNRLWGSLSSAARTDLLTGFVNGHGIDEILTNELERARINTHRVGLINVQLNGLRQLNKELGYEAGDEVLRRARPPARRVDAADRHRRPHRRVGVRDRAPADRRAHRLPARRADPDPDAPRLPRARLQAQRQPRCRRLPQARQQRRRAPARPRPPRRTRRSRSAPIASSSTAPTSRGRSRARAITSPGEGRAQLGTVLSLAEVLDLRDERNASHSTAVAGYCEMIGREMGLPDQRIQRLRLAGMLHDIGKVGIADSILDKPGPLSPSEWDQVRRHPEMAARILAAAELTDIRGWILARHEQPDGHGYPRGLTGDRDPARVADPRRRGVVRRDDQRAPLPVGQDPGRGDRRDGSLLGQPVRRRRRRRSRQGPRPGRGGQRRLRRGRGGRSGGASGRSGRPPTTRSAARRSASTPTPSRSAPRSIATTRPLASPASGPSSRRPSSPRSTSPARWPARCSIRTRASSARARACRLPLRPAAAGVPLARARAARRRDHPAGAMFDPASGIFDPALGLAGYRFVQRRQAFRWHEPVCSGDRIATVARLAAAEDRDGARYRTFESESVNQDGALVLEGRYQGVVPALEPSGPRERLPTDRSKPRPVRPSGWPRGTASPASGSPPTATRRSATRAPPSTSHRSISTPSWHARSACPGSSSTASTPTDSSPTGCWSRSGPTRACCARSPPASAVPPFPSRTVRSPASSPERRGGASRSPAPSSRANREVDLGGPSGARVAREVGSVTSHFMRW